MFDKWITPLSSKSSTSGIKSVICLFGEPFDIASSVVKFVNVTLIEEEIEVVSGMKCFSRKLLRTSISFRRVVRELSQLVLADAVKAFFFRFVR